MVGPRWAEKRRRTLGCNAKLSWPIEALMALEQQSGRSTLACTQQGTCLAEARVTKLRICVSRLGLLEDAGTGHPAGPR